MQKFSCFAILSSVQAQEDEIPEKQNTDILIFPKDSFTLLKRCHFTHS